MQRISQLALGFALVVAVTATAPCPAMGAGWARHTIDAVSRGADGVRLADVDGDGRSDIVTGWEEGGQIRIVLNPGFAAVREPWPSILVGQVKAPEDAVFVDLDGNGAIDVVSACEGKTRSLYVHWAPHERARYRDASAWRTEPIPVALGTQSWMFCLPLQVDGRRGVDLVVGSKLDGARLGWLEAPENPRDLAAWRYHEFCRAGWIMSLIALDVDGDGDPDIVASDRRGPTRGCFWLENPGTTSTDSTKPGWARHPIGGEDVEVMFLKVADLDGDGRLDIVAAAREFGLRVFRRRPGPGVAWDTSSIDLPKETGTAKGVDVGDINGDGRLDIVMTCENAQDRLGVVWFSYRGSISDRTWDVHDIDGGAGVKYDLVEAIDLDGDGDLDVLTCEEKENLGVIWYENPAKSAGSGKPSGWIKKGVGQIHAE